MSKSLKTIFLFYFFFPYFQRPSFYLSWQFFFFLLAIVSDIPLCSLPLSVCLSVCLSLSLSLFLSVVPSPFPFWSLFNVRPSIGRNSVSRRCTQFGGGECQLHCSAYFISGCSTIYHCFQGILMVILRGRKDNQVPQVCRLVTLWKLLTLICFYRN